MRPITGAASTFALPHTELKVPSQYLRGIARQIALGIVDFRTGGSTRNAIDDYLCQRPLLLHRVRQSN